MVALLTIRALPISDCQLPISDCQLPIASITYDELTLASQGGHVARENAIGIRQLEIGNWYSIHSGLDT